ncbi:MAG TPA: hypothetical protein VIR29_13365 [Anseongella sp.]
MKKSFPFIFLIASTILALNACKKEEASKPAGDFMISKLDGEPFGTKDQTDTAYALLDTISSPEKLYITSRMTSWTLSISIYDQSDYTGTFRFGNEVPGFFYHFAVITRVPGRYNEDSWFSNGDAISGDHSRGTVTIDRFDTVKHRIEGTYEGTFYNPNTGTTKVITDGKFSLPLTTLR